MFNAIKRNNSDKEGSFDKDNNTILGLMRVLTKQIPDQQIPKEIKDIVVEYENKIDARAREIDE